MKDTCIPFGLICKSLMESLCKLFITGYKLDVLWVVNLNVDTAESPQWVYTQQLKALT